MSIRLLFANPLLVPAMNFPAPLESLWRGKRFNSFNRVLYDLFRSLERLNPARIILPLYDATYRTMTIAPESSVDKRGTHNALHKVLEARDAWQDERFAAAHVETSILATVDHRQGASL